MRRTVAAAGSVMLTVSLFWAGSAGLAADGDEDSRAKRRMEAMREAVAGLRVESDEITEAEALRFAAKPLLRYNDPTRDLSVDNMSGLLDASVWRLGEAGRPTAILMLEIYGSGDGEGVLAYEFVSLSERPFSMALESKPEVAWDATGTDTTMSPLPDAPKPAATPNARLSQMRRIARRFAVREELDDGQVIECRLLAQPIDRYAAPDTGIVDGALFAFANGTNPEVALVVECDEEGWSYGFVRMSSAAATALLDGAEVARYGFFRDFGRREGAYASTTHPIELAE